MKETKCIDSSFGLLPVPSILPSEIALFKDGMSKCIELEENILEIIRNKQISGS